MDIHGYSWIFIDMWNMDIKCHQSFTLMLQSSVSYTSACLLLTLMIEPKRLVRPNGLCDTPWLSGRSKAAAVGPPQFRRVPGKMCEGTKLGIILEALFPPVLSRTAKHTLAEKKTHSTCFWTHLSLALIPSFLLLRSSYLTL